MEAKQALAKVKRRLEYMKLKTRSPGRQLGIVIAPPIGSPSARAGTRLDPAPRSILISGSAR